ADLAVLSEDILSVRPEAIGKTRVLLTMTGGKTEYEEKKKPLSMIRQPQRFSRADFKVSPCRPKKMTGTNGSGRHEAHVPEFCAWAFFNVYSLVNEVRSRTGRRSIALGWRRCPPYRSPKMKPASQR